MRTLLLVLALVLLNTPSVAAQSLADLLSTLRTGGGWVSIPIEGGRGELAMRPVPTGGMTLAGCIQIWPGHSGRWEIDATDTRRDETLEVRTRAGRPVPFTHRTGAVAQLELEVRWSEPRDTTLMMWVGLDGMGASEPDRDACEPVYGGGDGSSGASPRQDPAAAAGHGVGPGPRPYDESRDRLS